MEIISGEEIIKACRGTLISGKATVRAKGVFIDSRRVEEKGIFFALQGERADGHDYLGQAAEKACSIVVVEKKPTEFIEGMSYILVESTETALGDLAMYYLSKFPIKKIAITGSTGKTTTKEMLYSMASTRYKSVCNEGNLNNLIGLPLTVFNVDKSTELAIFEMGMDRLGEIHRLSEIVKPHMAMVTNVGLSHLSRLESRSNILKAKGEIRDFLGVNDLLIINGDDHQMKSWKAEKNSFSTIRVGRKEGNDASISNIEDLGKRGLRFDYSYKGVEREIYLASPGVHNTMNASLALTAIVELDFEVEKALEVLKDFKTGDRRLHFIELKNVTVIDDTYNASPDSVKAAVDVLASVKGERKIAILGDMFELGENTKAYHGEIGEYAFQKSIDVILSVGENAEEISLAAKKCSMNAFHFNDKEMLKTVLAQWIRKGDTILVKGSRGMAMEDIVEAIKIMGN